MYIVEAVRIRGTYISSIALLVQESVPATQATLKSVMYVLVATQVAHYVVTKIPTTVAYVFMDTNSLKPAASRYAICLIHPIVLAPCARKGAILASILRIAPKRYVTLAFFISKTPVLLIA